MRVSSGIASIGLSLLITSAAPIGAAAATKTAPIRVKLITSALDLDANGLGTDTDHAETIASNGGAATQIGQQHIPFDLDRDTPQIVEAYTLKADGTRENVDASAIYETPLQTTASNPLVSNWRQKVIIFPDVAAGDTVIYTVRHQFKAPAFPGQIFAGTVYREKIPVERGEHTLTVPKGVKLSIETHDLKFEKHDNGATITYRWVYRGSDSLPDDKKTAIDRINDRPHFLVSSLSDYAALGAAYWKLAAPAMAVTPKIQEQADRITSGISDKRAQAEALYNWVSGHIRYVAIELGAGAFIPHDADAVLAKGYGDCKDHVVLYAALLKAKGIASEPALINLGRSYELTNVPSFTALNHIITFLPEFNIYVDTTASVAPFGVLPFQEYGKPVVHATASGGALHTTPLLPPDTATVTFETNSTLDSKGHLTGTTVTTATGPSAITLRTIARLLETLGPEVSAQKLLEARGQKGKGNFEFASPTDLAPSYSVKSTYDLDGYENVVSGREGTFIPPGLRTLGYSGDGLMGPLKPGSLDDTAPTPCYSGHVIETITLTPPRGMRFQRVPQDAEIKTDNLVFSANWNMDGRALKVRREFRSTIATPLCEGRVRKDSADALAKIDSDSNTQIGLVPE